MHPSADTTTCLGAVPGMGKAQAAQTDQFVLKDCFASEEKKKKSRYIFPAGGNLFCATFGKLVHKVVPTLLLLKERILHKYNFLSFNRSTL